MTPQVKATLLELSKVRDLTHKHVFVYQRNPVREVKTALGQPVERLESKIYAFMTYATVLRPI
jgi:hypothetical protein